MFANAGDICFEQVLRIIFCVLSGPLALCMLMLFRSFLTPSMLMSAPPDKISELLQYMQSCISDVNAWETVSMLRLNDNKTELMLVTSKRTKYLHNLPTLIAMQLMQCSNSLQAVFLRIWVLQ